MAGGQEERRQKEQGEIRTWAMHGQDETALRNESQSGREAMAFADRPARP
jgi:hypothetical protein